MTQITKYKLINSDGSFTETLSLSEAQAHGEYEVLVEEIAQYLKPQTPSEVALWKLRRVLELKGLEDSVTSVIEQLSEPTRGTALKLWNFGNSVERYSPTVTLIKHALSINDDEADEIFIEADKIKL